MGSYLPIFDTFRVGAVKEGKVHVDLYGGDLKVFPALGVQVPKIKVFIDLFSKHVFCLPFFFYTLHIFLTSLSISAGNATYAQMNPTTKRIRPTTVVVVQQTFLEQQPMVKKEGEEDSL